MFLKGNLLTKYQKCSPAAREKKQQNVFSKGKNQNTAPKARENFGVFAFFKGKSTILEFPPQLSVPRSQIKGKAPQARKKITFLRVSKGKTSHFWKFWSFPPQLSVPPWFREKSARRGGTLSWYSTDIHSFLAYFRGSVRDPKRNLLNIE